MYPHYDTDSTAGLNYLSARPSGIPVGSRPIPGDPNEYIVRLNFTQRRDLWAPCPLNTTLPNSFAAGIDSYWQQWLDHLLVGESDITDIGGGVVSWTRTYALLPALDANDVAHIQPTTFSYRFPQFGFPNIVGGTNIWPYFTLSDGRVINFRPAFQQTVPAWIEFSYYLIGPGQTWATIEDLETSDKFLVEQFYAANQPNSVARGIAADFLLQTGYPGFGATIPSIDEYLLLCGQDISTNPPSTVVPTPIIVQSSSFQRWPAAPMGNIIERQTIKLIPR